MTYQQHVLKMVNVIEQPDGSARIILDLTSEFVNWAKQDRKTLDPQNLKLIINQAIEEQVNRLRGNTITDPEVEEMPSSSDTEALYKIFGGD